MTASSFTQIMRGPESCINVVEAALLFSREFFADVDVEVYLSKVDGIARQAARRKLRRDRPAFSAAALSHFLFDELGFRGNRRRYHDPRNSFLHHVIDRRLGIPISLCTLYVEIGRRCGLDLVGVGFPGHFLAMEERTGLLIDCFSGGRLITREDCAALLRRMYGPAAIMDERFLRPARPRETVLRMLNNLKYSFASSRQFEAALRAIELIDQVWPDQPDNVRDRGLMKAALHRYSEALRDLERYAALAPQAADAREVMERIRQIRISIAALN